MAATQVQFKIDCDGKKLVIVMDKKQDYVIMDWQSARGLGDALMQAVGFLADKLPRTDRTTDIWELKQVKLAGHKGKVAFMTAWTDRIIFTSLAAAAMLGQALMKLAHDMELEEQDIKLAYDETGFVSKIQDMKTGVTQRVS